MMRKMMLCALVAIGIASTATAATRSTRSTAAPSRTSALSPTMIGPQVGFSVNPDQVVVGGHLTTGFAPDWTLNPGVEVGFGDHATVTSINFDTEYHFHIVGSTWAPYVGGGLGVHFIHVNMDFPFSDFSDTVTGFNLIVGTTVPTSMRARMFTELRIGAGDSGVPDLKGALGWNFGL